MGWGVALDGGDVEAGGGQAGDVWKYTWGEVLDRALGWILGLAFAFSFGIDIQWSWIA